MTEQEYADIAAACDRLLQAPDSSLARVAIPMLHVINEHPGCTTHYEPTIPSGHASRGMRPLAPWEDAPRALLRAARAVMRGSMRDTRGESQNSAPVDVLIVSHLINPAQLQDDDDFYFGPLQRLLRERGVTSMLVLIDHLPQPSHGRQVLPNTASPGEEARWWLQAFRERNALRKAARNAGSRLDASIAMLASRHAWLAPTVANLRLHGQLARICRARTPKVVLTTYEGEACERLIWNAARSGGYRPLCVGYQHSRVLPRAHAIRRPLSNDCDPDVILTLGEHPHAALAASPRLNKVKLISYGTHRHPAPPPMPAAERNTCVVLPDSDPHECALLFDFAIACATQLPDTTFMLRPHPGTGLEPLLRLAPALNNRPANAILSAETALAEDCARAKYCLYRGSSAVLQAVIAGVKPFYVTRPGELPFDMLAAMPGWRETVTSPADFVARIQSAPKAGAEGSSGPYAAREAAAFCRQFTSPLRPAALDELLDLIER